MTMNNQDLSQSLMEQAAEYTDHLDEYGDDDDDAKNEWKRAIRYCAGIFAFFYILFKYLI